LLPGYCCPASLVDKRGDPLGDWRWIVLEVDWHYDEELFVHFDVCSVLLMSKLSKIIKF
jgi:hypothetical protein